MEEDEDYEIKWWKDWLEADCIQRVEMVEKLPFVNEMLDIDKLPKNMRKHSISLMLNSFFEDLESALYTKRRLDEKKK